MIQKKKEKVELYQLPSCTICLQDEAFGLVSLKCGHVFHYHCLRQSYEFSNLCPNCKARSFTHEWHQLSYHASLSTSQEAMMNELFKSLAQDQKQSFIKLVQQYQQLNGKYIKTAQNLRDRQEDLLAAQRLVREQSQAAEKHAKAGQRSQQSLRQMSKDYNLLELRVVGLQAQAKKYKNQLESVYTKKDLIERYQTALKHLDSRQAETQEYLNELKSNESREVYLLDSLSILQARCRQLKEHVNELNARYVSQKSRAQNLSAIIKTLRAENDKLLEKYRRLEKRAKSRNDEEDSKGSISERAPTPVDIASLFPFKERPKPQSVPTAPNKKMHFSLLREMHEKKKVD